MILLSNKVDKKIIEHIKTFHDDIIFLPDISSLPKEIAFHTDLGCFFVKDTLICCPEIYDFLKIELKDRNIKLLKGEKIPTGGYPKDIFYNAAIISNYMFCKEECTEPIILQKITDLGYEIVNVKQGYTKCSISKVSERSIITSDKEIEEKAKERGIRTFFASNEGVKLNGFNNGFIGGASFLIEKMIYFTGNLNDHPQIKELYLYPTLNGVLINWCEAAPLYDYGSPIYIPNY